MSYFEKRIPIPEYGPVRMVVREVEGSKTFPYPDLSAAITFAGDHLLPSRISLRWGAKTFLDSSSNDEYTKGASMQPEIRLIPNVIRSCCR